MQLSLLDLAGRIGAQLRGEGARRIQGVAPLSEAGPDRVAFYANPRYRKELAATRAAAVIVPPDDVPRVPPRAASLLAAQPYRAFAKASPLFFSPLVIQPGGPSGALVPQRAR